MNNSIILVALGELRELRELRDLRDLFAIKQDMDQNLCQTRRFANLLLIYRLG